MKQNMLLVFILVPTVVLFSMGCEKTPPPGGKTQQKDTSDTAPLPQDTDSDTTAAKDSESDTRPPAQDCGDGNLTDNEACDDKNNDSGDGCAGNCLSVEEGWSCNPPGTPCHPVARCGDGQIATPELCDDGNLIRNDGCNDLCMVEVGFKCTTDSPGVCTPTVCGDNLIEGAEGCDDGNDVPFDGCNAMCQLEPNCKDGGNCTSSCGDGLLIGEYCDDGNNIDGDGCAADCTVEQGYDCKQPDVDAGVIEVPVIYKDFSSAHADFELGAMNCDTVSEEMVKATLDENGKPVFNQSVGTCGALSKLEEWYDHSDPGAVVVSTLKLFYNGSGEFVNQWGVNGESWRLYSYEEDGWCSNASCDDEACLACNLCIESCWDGGAACCGSVEYLDGDPFFFPMDGLGITDAAEYGPAGTGPPYDLNFQDEQMAEVAAQLAAPEGYSYDHNFHFTSEVRFWFQYNESETQTLRFLGDDDVWVFINNQLAVDLGGIHSPLEAKVTINDLGLTDGNVYEIVVFQAERQTNGSSYRLTLSGFSTTRSECRPDCGDGFIGLGEECDDGINDGGYGECADGCKLDEFCGDGIVQEEHEICDDGNTLNGDDCPSSCRKIVVE